MRNIFACLIAWGVPAVCDLIALSGRHLLLLIAMTRLLYISFFFLSLFLSIFLRHCHSFVYWDPPACAIKQAKVQSIFFIVMGRVKSLAVIGTFIYRHTLGRHGGQTPSHYRPPIAEMVPRIRLRLDIKLTVIWSYKKETLTICPLAH